MENIVKRQDKEGNVYALPESLQYRFDADCDEAVIAQPEEAIGLWIDIKTNYESYKV